MKFSWPWYVAALVLLVVRNWYEILYSSNPMLMFRLLGAYLVDLLIVYVVFDVYRRYRERKAIE